MRPRRIPRNAKAAGKCVELSLSGMWNWTSGGVSMYSAARQTSYVLGQHPFCSQSVS
jgi:hypothetical protein